MATTRNRRRLRKANYACQIDGYFEQRDAVAFCLMVVDNDSHLHDWVKKEPRYRPQLSSAGLHIILGRIVLPAQYFFTLPGLCWQELTCSRIQSLLATTNFLGEINVHRAYNED